MKFGAQVGVYRTTWDKIRTVVENCEKGAWNSVWFADHFLPPPPRREQEHLNAHEGYSVAAAAAGFTERLEIGHMVLGNTYRNPALAAKMGATVDQISHGRFTLSIGAAWFKREHEAYGWYFPEMKERQDRLQEACELIRKLFHATEPVTYQGQHYQLDEAPLAPGCFDRPIPIMVGGTGPKRTLKTLAMFGDVFNLDGWAGGPMTRDYLDFKWNILEEHCAAVGRDPKEIRKTILIPTLLSEDQEACQQMIKNRRLGEGSAIGSKQYIIDRIGEIIEGGVDEIMIGGLLTDRPETYLEYEEEVLSAFK